MEKELRNAFINPAYYWGAGGRKIIDSNKKDV